MRTVYLRLELLVLHSNFWLVLKKKIFSGFLPCGLTLAVLTSSQGVYPFLSVAPYIVGHPLLVFLSRV
jgi:hypothetical protein